LKKPNPVEQALDRLASLKADVKAASLSAELKAFLTNRSNLVVGQSTPISENLRHHGISGMVFRTSARTHKKAYNFCRFAEGVTGLCNELF